MKIWNRVHYVAIALCGILFASIGATRGFAQFATLDPVYLNPENFIEITAGEDFTCARKISGKVYCWGWNYYGQTGGGNQNVTSPTVTIYSGSKQIVAGTHHACSLATDGKVQCWGSSSRGQLGGNVYGDSTLSGVINVVGNQTFSSIAAGGRSTCGTGPQGLFCWGEIMNWFIPNPGWGQPAPTLVTPYNGFGNITIGDMHFCGAAGNTVICGGNNNRGQAGLDPVQFPFAQFFSTSSLGYPVSRAAAKTNFTCADNMNGYVQCTGANNNGQLGNGVGADSGAAVTVGEQIVPVYGSRGIRYVKTFMKLGSVATGFNHACALDPNGLAYCWGNGRFGQLGNNYLGTGTESSADFFGTPQAVAGGIQFRAIAAGSKHTCAIAKNNNVIYCWGDNRSGQLGNGYQSGSYPFPWSTNGPY